jgi:cyanophycinase
MRKILLFSLLLILLTAFGVSAQEGAGTTLIPIGGFYVETFPGFAQQAIDHALTLDTDRVYILMMPYAYTYNPVAQTEEELVDNELAAENRRRQLEDACSELAPEELSCHVVVPPFYTRESVQVEIALDYFDDDLAGIYFLGGDQTWAMQIVAGTPIEEAMRAAFVDGVPMGGNSAGLAILSWTMIGGYLGDFGPETGLNEGAVDIWNGEDADFNGETVPRRGLDFGPTNVVLEQHFWERARLARLLNTIVQPDVPHLGVGVDSFTGGLVLNNATFGSVFGVYGAAVFDAETLGAAESASYVGGVLSVRNVLVHVLAPGEFGYSLDELQPSWVNATGTINRDWTTAFDVPQGAGMLMLHSNLTEIVAEEAGSFANAVAIITAYADDDDAADVAELYEGSAVEVIQLAAGDALPDLTGYGMIIVHAGDQSLIDVEQLEPLRAAWEGGSMLMMDDAASAAAGMFYSAHAPTPYDSDDDVLIEAATQGSFMLDATEIRPGLGLFYANVEPSVLDDNRYGRLFSLAYAHPELPALALNDNVIVTIEPSMGALVDARSTNGLIVLDFGGAALTAGDNGYMVVGNGVLDVFAPGEMVIPTNS